MLPLIPLFTQLPFITHTYTSHISSVDGAPFCNLVVVDVEINGLENFELIKIQFG
jgi:hypothetical protein